MWCNNPSPALVCVPPFWADNPLTYFCLLCSGCKSDSHNARLTCIDIDSSQISNTNAKWYRIQTQQVNMKSWKLWDNTAISMLMMDKIWIWSMWLCFLFLTVQNSSIGDLVPWLVGWSVGPLPLTIRVFTTLQSEPRDLWPLRHLIRVMRRHDLTKKSTYPPTYQP